jgi:tetratricopeptide (TPR) repeat protein
MSILSAALRFNFSVFLKRKHLWLCRCWFVFLLFFSSTVIAESFETKFNQAQRLVADGKFEEAFNKADAAFTEAKAKLNPDDPMLAKFLNLLADLYLNRGKFKIAIAYHENAIAIRKMAYGELNYEVAESLNNLGITYYSLQHYENAEKYLQESLDVCEKIFATDHLSLAYPLENLGKLYRDMGRYVESEVLFLRAIKIREKAKVSSSLLASTLRNCGELYLLMGAYAKAKSIFVRALKYQDEQKKQDPTAMMKLCQSLADISRKLGDPDAAKKYDEQAVQHSSVGY